MCGVLRVTYDVGAVYTGGPGMDGMASRDYDVLVGLLRGAACDGRQAYQGAIFRDTFSTTTKTFLKKNSLF